MNYLDILTSRHTAFDKFDHMVNAGGNYRPSFYLKGKSRKAITDIAEIVAAYNRTMAERGDDRRAYCPDTERTWTIARNWLADRHEAVISRLLLAGVTSFAA